MNTPDIRAAARRLRRDASIDYGFSPYVSDAERNTDVLAVCRAVLELHPADENEPVTPEWCRQVGVTVRAVDNSDGYELAMFGTRATVRNKQGEPLPIVVEVLFRPDGSVFDACLASYQGNTPYTEDINIPQPLTRSGLRSLCAGLGVPLKEIDR